jgi:hypothetical protein
MSDDYNEKPIPTVTHVMTSGTVSPITFRARVGTTTAGTITLNGSAGGREFGGVLFSSISVTEYAS